MFGWWRTRREKRERLDAEARALIARHGDRAYHVARERMVDAMRLGDIDENSRWTRIRARIAKLTNHPGYRGDTATRYLADRRNP